MNDQRDTTTAPGAELLGELAGWAAAGGMFTMILFPFALPFVLLLVASLLPLLVLPLALGLLAAVVAVPVLLIRHAGRLARRAFVSARPGGWARTESSTSP